MIRLIAAIDSRRGLARNGVMPWKIPEDERYFTRMTKTYGGNVLTGGVTFRDGYRGRPLTGRTNYILTRQEVSIPGATIVHDLDKLLEAFSDKDLWVAGGAEVFKAVMAAGRADELYLTQIEGDFGCDRFFPEYHKDFKLADRGEPREQNGYRFAYARYVRA